jgi:competence protein ComEA
MRRVVSKSLGAVLLMALLLGMAQAAVAETKQININTATAEDLTSLKGLGTVKSQAIIEHREKHGPFKTVDDLKVVPGIGDKLLEQLRPQITVGAAPAGGTTSTR